MWEGKYYMEVRGVNDFGFPFVHPDFFQHGLTVRAVPIPAGIVVNFHMPAVSALADIVSQLSCFTVKDGMGSLFLNTGLMMYD